MGIVTEESVLLRPVVRVLIETLPVVTVAAVTLCVTTEVETAYTVVVETMQEPVEVNVPATTVDVEVDSE